MEKSATHSGKDVVVLQPCSKEFPNMQRGKFEASDCTRMICDFNPRKKILKTIVESVGGYHSSGVCEGHFEIMKEWMNGRLEVVFPDGSPIKEKTSLEDTVEMMTDPDGGPRKWRFDELKSA